MTYQLGGCGVKDEPLIVPLPLGAEKRTTTNVIAADANSLVYAQTERDFLRILFRTRNVTKPGGLFPPVLGSTKEQLQFVVNLHIYKIELLLHSSIGCGINDISPGLVKGPAAIGTTLANLDNRTKKFMLESGLASVGNIMAIADMTLLKTPLPMPQLDLRHQVYNTFFYVINVTFKPPYNVYANTNSFPLAVVIALYETVSYGVFRSLLKDRANLALPPYTIRVAKFSNLTAKVTKQLGGCGVKDEVAGGGLKVVPSWLFFIIFPLLQFGQEYCRKNLAGQVLALYFPSWMWDADSHSGRVVQLLHLLGQAVPAHLLAADRCSY
ncbi:hypothetical protein GQ457_15G016900 [Hibiscus cannabinus]